MKKTGVILLVVGALFTVLTSLNFTFNGNEDDVNRGNFNISPRSKHLTWLPIIGLAVMIFGGTIYMMGVKKILSKP